MADRVEVKLQRCRGTYVRMNGNPFACADRLDSLTGERLPRVIWLCAQKDMPSDGVAYQFRWDRWDLYATAEQFISARCPLTPFYFWVEYE